jgi:hypothetical protein
VVRSSIDLTCAVTCGAIILKLPLLSKGVKQFDLDPSRFVLSQNVPWYVVWVVVALVEAAAGKLTL